MQVNFKKVGQVASRMDWYISESDPVAYLSKLTDKIHNGINLSKQKKFMKSKPKKNWMTEELVRLTEERDSLYKHYRKNKHNKNDEKVARFKKVRNRINLLKLQLKAEYANSVIQESCDANKMCPKDLHKKLRVFVNGKNKKKAPCASIKN